MSKTMAHPSKLKAFTLIEILGVLLLIALFLGVGIYAFQATQTASFRRQTNTTLQSNAALLQTFMAKSGSYPDNFLNDMPTLDAWGQSLIYQHSGNGFSLRSVAEDGLLNTADDITYVEE